MASIGSLTGGGSVSSVYGNRNILSGLASGLDTESMIENAISGYKMKLDLLNQQRTRVEWQQSSMRDIISKMVDFNKKYTSFSSGTNLLSPGYFNSSVKILSQGENAEKVSASGHSNSVVEVNSVTALAHAARYSVDSVNLSDCSVAQQAFDLVNGSASVGKLAGSMTLGYGGTEISINFNDKDVFDSAEEMAKVINEKLADEVIGFQSGSQAKANERIRAVVKESNGSKQIAFETVKSDDTNTVWIDRASGSLEAAMNIKTEGDEKDLKEFTFDKTKMTEEKKLADMLFNKGFSISIDGVVKTVKGPDPSKLKEGWTNDDYLTELQKNIDEAFGENKLVVTNADTTGKMQFQFTSAEPDKNHKIAVSTDAGKLVGMEDSCTSYVNLNRSIGALLKNGNWDQWRLEGKGNATASADGTYHTDEDGNRVALDTRDNKWYRVDDKGETLYDFQMNGQSIGQFTKETKLAAVMKTINDSKTADVTVTYSEFTQRFVFTSNHMGSDSKVDFSGKDGAKGLAAALFETSDSSHCSKTDGADAKFTVTVNGEVMNDVVRNSNTIDIDGMHITLKGEFAADTEGVSFKVESDADKIIDVVKDMVKDYNEMAGAIKDAYSTLPLQNSKGKPYMPLTDKDRKDMSESEIKDHEAKAKTGLLFADRDLAALYDGLQSAVGVLNMSGNKLENIGLTTSFASGRTTLALDENKLRKALEQDPDLVRDVFTRSVESGDKSDGLMHSLKKELDRYASTTGAQKGVLIERSGSPLAPTSIFQNAYQNKIDNFNKQILSWQNKLSDQIDYYNAKFTALEMMTAEMNNQSGMLMGLGGGF